MEIIFVVESTRSLYKLVFEDYGVDEESVEAELKV